jgi:dihydrofolate reductase
MKAILVAAVTADGFISKRLTDRVDWTSQADKKHFANTTKAIGTMIVGSRTFDTIGQVWPGRRMIVMTSRPERYSIEGLETFTGTPQEILDKLAAEGLHEVAIIGGSGIYGQFLEAGLIDELILTIEPKLFGQGVSLSAVGLDANLSLTSTELLGENSLLLHYKVER